MLSGLHVRRVSWTVIDQGIVSAGTFALNLILARHVLAAEYGTFVLLYGALLTLQLFNATLLLYPLSVRLAVAKQDEQPRLMAASLVLVAILSAGLCGVVAAATTVLGRPDLLWPSITCFMAWQLQETLRRGLLANFRHQTAAAGDALSYIGQGIVILILAMAGGLTLASIFYALAATSLIGGLLQAYQLGIQLGPPLHLRMTILDYWRIGGGWSLGNGILTQVPGIVIPWCLAAIAGTAAVGGFQAANNIVNLSNPLLIGLANIIPQAASAVQTTGNQQAWEVARRYALLALPVLLVYSALVLASPDAILSLFYGTQSTYLTLGPPLAILILGRIVLGLTEVVTAYLHGITEVRLAFLINMTGAALAILLSWPAIMIGGLTGISIALLAIQAIRLLVARIMLQRTLSVHPAGYQRRDTPANRRSAPAVSPQ